MKKYFFIAVATTVLSCQQKISDLASNSDLIKQDLKGHVQHYEEIGFRADSAGKAGVQDSLVMMYSFDNKGYQTRFQTLYPNGQIKDEQTIDHYPNGAAKEVINKTHGKQTFRMEIFIDKDGKYTMAKAYDSADKMSSYYKEITQNEYGEVLSGNQYHTDNSLQASFNTTYDKANYTGNINKDSTGKVKYSVNATLNSKGEPVELVTTTYKKDGTTTTEKVKYRYDTYDEKGNWTQRTTLDENDKPVKVTKRIYAYYK